MAFETRRYAEKFLLRKDLLHLSIAMLPNSMAALSRALFAHKKKQFQKGSFPSAIAVNFRKIVTAHCGSCAIMPLESIVLTSHPVAGSAAFAYKKGLQCGSAFFFQQAAYSGNRMQKSMIQ